MYFNKSPSKLPWLIFKAPIWGGILLKETWCMHSNMVYIAMYVRKSCIVKYSVLHYRIYCMKILKPFSMHTNTIYM